MFPVVMRFAILIGVLSAIYIALDSYMRWDRERRLAAEHVSGVGGSSTREEYIAKGMAKYEQSWERKLLYGIFLLPIVVALLIALIANYG